MGWVHRAGNGHVVKRHDLPASIDRLGFEHAFCLVLRSEGNGMVMGHRLAAPASLGSEYPAWR